MPNSRSHLFAFSFVIFLFLQSFFITGNAFASEGKTIQLPIASLVKIPPKDTCTNYNDLVCTQEDKEKIVELITTIGTYGKIDLFLNHEKRCRNIEKEIRHVHPMKFLATIFSRPDMKKYMKEVNSDWFKWKAFIDGLSPNMTAETLKKKTYLYLPDFAKEVGYKEYELKTYIDKKDWSGFVEYLIYH